MRLAIRQPSRLRRREGPYSAEPRAVERWRWHKGWQIRWGRWWRWRARRVNDGLVHVKAAAIDQEFTATVLDCMIGGTNNRVPQTPNGDGRAKVVTGLRRRPRPHLAFSDILQG